MRISDWSSDVCSSDLKAFAANHSAWPPPGPLLERAREGAVVGKTQKISDFTKTHAALEILKSQFFQQLTQDIGEGRPFFLYPAQPRDRTRVGLGKSLSVRVDLGCRRII